MKKNSIILWIACLLLTTRLSAQNTIITYGKQEPIDKVRKGRSEASGFEEVYINDSNYYYQRRMMKATDNEEFVIMKISKQSDNVIWEKTIPEKAYKDRMSFSGMQKSDDGFIVFSDKKDSKTKDYSLEAQYLDENFNMVGAKKSILQSSEKRKNGLKSFFTFKVQKIGDFFLVNGAYYSDDLKNLNMDPFKRKTFYYAPRFIQPPVTTLYLLDKNLNLVWEKTASLPITELYMMEKIYLDKYSNLTAIFKTSPEYFESESKLDKVKSDHFFIVNYNHQKQIIQTIPFPLDVKFDYHGNDTSFFDSTHNQLNILGQYHGASKPDGYQGLYFLQYNLEDMTLTKNDNIHYTSDFLKHVVGKQNPLKDKLSFDYHLKNVFLQPDGEYTVIINKDYMGKVSTLGQDNYYFGDIIIMRISKNSKIKWAKQIPRETSSLLTDYKFLNSYTLNVTDTTYVLFNADINSGFETKDGFQLSFNDSKIRVLKILGYNNDGDLIVNEHIKQEGEIQRMCEFDKATPINDHQLRLTFQEYNAKYKRIGGVNAILEFK